MVFNFNEANFKLTDLNNVKEFGTYKNHAK